MSKQIIQFKESPKTSRANTPTSGYMKYDTDMETNDNKHDEMSAMSAVILEETTEDEDEQPRDLRYRSINNLMTAIHRAQASDVASRAAIAAMIRGPGSGVTAGMPFHSISSVNSSNAAGTTNVSAQLPLMHAHQSLLNFPPPTIMPPTRVEVTTSASGGSSVVTVGAGTGTGTIAGTVVTSTNSSNINSSVSITPTTSISVAGSSGGGGGGGGGSGGPTWGGAYTCDRCGNSYARPHSLNRHVRFECGVEPKFECPICHKKSKHKHNLVLHMRTHQHR